MRNEELTAVDVRVCHAAVAPGEFDASVRGVGVSDGVGCGVGVGDGVAEGVGDGLGMWDTCRKKGKNLPCEGGQHKLGPLLQQKLLKFCPVEVAGTKVLEVVLVMGA